MLGSHLFSSTGYAALMRDGFGWTRGQVYSEEAFQRVLFIERKRAQRATSSFLLLLVRLRGDSGCIEIPPAIATPLFEGLRLCFREVDFVGWHREGRIAGAVLAQGRTAPDADASTRVVARVTDALATRLPSAVRQRLDVRVVRLGGGGSA